MRVDGLGKDQRVHTVSDYIKQKLRSPMMFVLPTMIYLTAMTIFPMLYLLGLSLYRWNLTEQAQPSFIGLNNYIAILTDPVFSYSVVVTFIFAAVATSIELLLGIGVAMLVSREGGLMKAARSIIIIPLMLTPIITSVIWKYLYLPYGPLNYMLSLIGVSPLNWLFGYPMVWVSLLLIDIWQWTPFVAIILISGMFSLPVDVYESATMDGAPAWRKFRYLTLPLLWPILLIAIIFRSLDALKVFDTVIVLTTGGPGTMTEVLNFYIYRQGLDGNLKLGYGAAASVLFLIMSGVVSIIFMFALYSRRRKMQ